MRYFGVGFPSNLQDEGQHMSTPQDDASGVHEPEAQERKPDERVQAAPNDARTRNAKPREQGDEFSVLLHLGLV